MPTRCPWVVGSASCTDECALLFPSLVVVLRTAFHAFVRTVPTPEFAGGPDAHLSFSSNSTPIVLIKSLCQFLPYLGFSHPQRVSQLARYDARRSREGMDQGWRARGEHELHVVPVVIAHVGHRGGSSKILLRAGRSHRFSSDSAFRAPWCLHSSDDGRPNERTGVALCSCEARTHKDGGPALAEKSVRPLGPTWCPPCMEVC